MEKLKTGINKDIEFLQISPDSARRKKIYDKIKSRFKLINVSGTSIFICRLLFLFELDYWLFTKLLE